MKYKRYDKKFDFAYCFGHIPTIELIKSDYQIEEIFISTKLPHNEYTNLINETSNKKITVTYNDRLIEKISYKENTLVIAAFKKQTKAIISNQKQIVLFNPSNPGNLGTIMRSMHAFEFNNLAIIKPAVDIFMPKVISASMGSFFSLNIEYFETIEDYVAQNQLPIYVLDSNAKNIFTTKTIVDDKFVLLFGNESTGIPNHIVNNYPTFKLNHSNQVESLNLGISISIVLSMLYN